jgi:alkylation response protein AidB-like acyl-CoA dehydrogenase
MLETRAAHIRSCESHYSGQTVPDTLLSYSRWVEEEGGLEPMNVTVRKTPSERASDASDILERARALVPVLRQREAAALAARDVPAETIADFRAAGLLDLLKPRRFGGSEASPVVFSETVEQLAFGCASSAWVYAVLVEHSWLAASFPEQAQIDMWGANPDAVASSSLAPRATAMPAKGGYRLSGRWPFSSGSTYAQWAIIGTFVEADGRRDAHYMLVPMSDIRIIDDWRVFGLLATGSRTLELDNVFVPEHRTVPLSDLNRGTPPGRDVHPHYRLLRAPRALLAVFSQSPVTIALGRRALDLVVNSLKKRNLRTGGKADQSELIQSKLAESAAEIDMAALVLSNGRRSALAALESGEAISAEQIAVARRDVAFALRYARTAVERLCGLTGTQWLYDDAPLQAILRDVMAASLHLTANWDLAMVGWARVRLGIDPRTL